MRVQARVLAICIVLFAGIVAFQLRSVAIPLPVPVPHPPVPTVPPVPKLPSVPGLDLLFSGESPVTTGLDDAITSIPFIDNYTPAFDLPLLSMPHDGNGVFHLQPGSYIYEARSYCLHAGKHGPSHGSGYLYAPLRGSRAPIIHDILVNSATHVDIPQKKVQELIWAVLARAKISSMSPDLQAAALKLLKPAQILTLNQGAVGFIPADMQAQVLARVPDPLKPVFEAENSLRGMLASNATYQELERVAVPPQSGPSATSGPLIPLGRWSYDPHGFFVQYFPHGYSWTTTRVNVPMAVSTTRDSAGRVTALTDGRGDRIEISYGSTAPVTVGGDNAVQLYRYQSVRFVWEQPRGGKSLMHQTVSNDPQWVAVGVPSGGGHVSAALDGAGAQARYDTAVQYRTQFAALVRSMGHANADLSELMTIAELRDALGSIADHTNQPSWLAFDMDLPVAAWEVALIKTAGNAVALRALNEDQEDDPSGQVGQPGNTNDQRLSQSPGCRELPPNPMQNAIGKTFSDNNFEKKTYGYSERIAYTNTPGSGRLDFVIRYGPDGVPIPSCDTSHPPSYWVAGSISNNGDAALTTGNNNAVTGMGVGHGSTPTEGLANAIKDMHNIPPIPVPTH